MIARTRRRTLSLLCLGVLVLIALVPRDTAAQVLYGSVVGDVKDATGGALPGATLVITSTDRGFSREAVTDAGGALHLLEPACGHVQPEGPAAGLQRLRAEGSHRHHQRRHPRGRHARDWRDGRHRHRQRRATDAADRHGRGARHPGRRGADEPAPVPLGRNYQQMYRMLPGFAPPINSHSIPSNPSRSLEFTVNGTSDDQNNTRIDGVSTYNVQLPHVSSYVPTLEAIEEVNVVTSSMGAEQGLAGGAAINLQTRAASMLSTDRVSNTSPTRI